MVVDTSGPSRAGSSSQKLSIYLINGVATVWEAQTAAILHCSHGISGLRAGTLPGVSQQNAFLGLPVTLTPEETAWCINSGVAQLVPLNPTPSIPSSSEISTTTRARIDRIQTYLSSQAVDTARKESLARAAYEKGGEKARLKREARAKAKAEKEKLKAQTTEEEGLFGAEDQAPTAGPSRSVPGTSPNGPTKSDTLPPVPDSTPGDGGKTPLYPHEVASHPFFPHLTYAKPITRLPHPLFPFPATRRDRALVDTFTALHDRGYRIGLGPRFGGEYLVYPGDYLRYHAHFTSQILIDDQPIRPMELVAWGRLGTGTKKAGLICCWEGPRLGAASIIVDEGRAEEAEVQEDELNAGSVEFYSLEWANFG